MKVKSPTEMTDRELLIEIVETMRAVREAMQAMSKHPLLGSMAKGFKF